jgi:hypothetical protein
MPGEFIMNRWRAETGFASWDPGATLEILPMTMQAISEQIPPISIGDEIFVIQPQAGAPDRWRVVHADGGLEIEDDGGRRCRLSQTTEAEHGGSSFPEFRTTFWKVEDVTR